MVRWFLIAVIVWLAVLTVLTLIAIFRHSGNTSNHAVREVMAAAR